MTTANAFRWVQLSQLKPSPTNPRKHFDQAKLAELAESIKADGVLEPLLVRPVGDGWEVVAGERRFRAAKLAGLKTLPVIVCDVTAERALELQVVENLQRDDLHPVEEAEGYETLQRMSHLTPEQIAAKVGKSTTYVHQRLSLLRLIEPARKAFLKEEITLGHAQLIARLQPEQQKQVMKELFDNPWVSSDNDTPGVPISSGDLEVKVARSVKEVDAYIRANILLDLSAAPFKLTDETLLPKAGACSVCPKRTGNQAALFADIRKGDVCSDPECYTAKFEAHIARAQAEAEEQGGELLAVSRDPWTSKKGLLRSDEYRAATKNEVKAGKAKRALVVEGGDRGHVVDIVLTVKKAETRSAESDKRAQEARDQARKTKKEAYRRQLIMGELVKKLVKPLSEDELRFVVRELFERTGADYQVAFMRSLGFEREGVTYHQEQPFEKKVLSKAKTHQELFGLLYAVALSPELSPRSYKRADAPNLMAAAKWYGVDLKSVAAQVAVKFPDRRKPEKKGGKKK